MAHKVCRAATVLGGLAILALSLLENSLIDATAGYGPVLLILAGLGCLVTLLGLVLPAAMLAKASLAVSCTLLLLLSFEAGFRLVGYDFQRSREAFEAVPICYRQAIVPLAPVYFRRPGPDRWHGKPMSVYFRSQGGLPEESDVTITYDSEGFRNPDHLADWDIVVVGDSFVELGFLPFEELFTTHLGESLNKSVKNLGVSYEGTFTEIAYLERYGKSPSTKHAILVFFEGNDLFDIDIVEVTFVGRVQRNAHIGNR